MRASRVLFNAAKKGGFPVPVELTPLFVAMGVAVCSATFFTYKKFAYDKSLRLTRNPRQTAADLDALLKEEASKPIQAAESAEEEAPAPGPIAEAVAEVVKSNADSAAETVAEAAPEAVTEPVAEAAEAVSDKAEEVAEKVEEKSE